MLNSKAAFPDGSRRVVESASGGKIYAGGPGGRVPSRLSTRCSAAITRRLRRDTAFGIRSLPSSSPRCPPLPAGLPEPAARVSRAAARPGRFSCRPAAGCRWQSGRGSIQRCGRPGSRPCLRDVPRPGQASASSSCVSTPCWLIMTVVLVTIPSRCAWRMPRETPGDRP